METVSRGTEKQTKLKKNVGRKMKTNYTSLCSHCFYPNRWTKRGLFDLQGRKNTGNPQAMSVPPHVTKQPHLVGKLVALRERTRVNKHPTSLAQATASAAPLKRSTVSGGVSKAFPGASGFQTTGRVRL